MIIPDVTDFSPREYAVLQLCARGKNNKEIAEALDISVHTVKAYVRSLLIKFGNVTREQMVITSIKLNLVNQDELVEFGKYKERF